MPKHISQYVDTLKTLESLPRERIIDEAYWAGRYDALMDIRYSYMEHMGKFSTFLDDMRNELIKEVDERE